MINLAKISLEANQKVIKDILLKDLPNNLIDPFIRFLNRRDKCENISSKFFTATHCSGVRCDNCIISNQNRSKTIKLLKELQTISNYEIF